MQNYLVGRIRTVSRRRLVVWAAVGGVVALACAANARYFRNVARGPRPVGAADLARIADPDREPDYYVRVTGSKAVETGLDELAVRKQGGREVSRTVAAHFVGLRVGDKFLLVKRGAETDPMVAEGALVPIPSDVGGQLFAGDDAKLRNIFYPFMLDTMWVGGPGVAGYATGGTALVVALLAGGVAFRRLRNPDGHPLMRRVRGWGDAVAIAADVEQERRAGALLEKGNVLFTPTFLIRESFFSFDVHRLADVLWGYKKVTKHSVNYVPTGKSYEAVLQFPDGEVTVPGKEPEVNGVLGHVAQAVPWAVFGYDEHLAGTFRKDRARFAAAVAGRREAVGAAKG